jgi:hypothetical protein
MSSSSSSSSAAGELTVHDLCEPRSSASNTIAAKDVYGRDVHVVDLLFVKQTDAAAAAAAGSLIEARLLFADGTTSKGLVDSQTVARVRAMRAAYPCTVLRRGSDVLRQVAEMSAEKDKEFALVQAMLFQDAMVVVRAAANVATTSQLVLFVRMSNSAYTDEFCDRFEGDALASMQDLQTQLLLSDWQLVDLVFDRTFRQLKLTIHAVDRTPRQVHRPLLR